MSAHPVAECKFYVKGLLPKLIEDCDALLPNGYVFQQDSAPAHFSRLAQEWIGQHCPNLIKKDEWPPNSPDLSPLNYHVWGAMLEKYKAYMPKPTNTAKLKTVLEAIWEELRSIWLCWHSGRGSRSAYRQKGATSSTFSSRHQHRKTALFRATNNFKKKSHSVHIELD